MLKNLKKISILVLLCASPSASAQDLLAVNAPMTTVTVGAETNAVSAQGNLLANSIGLTLYTFVPDKGQSAPVCNAACAEKWPPYLLTAAEEAKLEAPLGMITRLSGLKQLTINGSPVYTYYEDRLAGDAKGEGLGAVWFVIKAD